MITMRAEQVKSAASRLMHLHYEGNDVENIIACFTPAFSWIGAGEKEYAATYEEAVDFFRRFRGAIPKCNIWDEQYDVMEVAPDTYICSGMMWIATDPHTQMYLKVHQRVTFVFRWIEGRLLCSHIHCSNPYTELVDDELFPDKIGKHTYTYIQERVKQLEEETRQKNRQLEVVMASIPGGLKISRDDASYSFLYISKEAAALFGYTVEEFMEMSGGSAVGATYPPDIPRALQDCKDAFRNGGTEYTLKYRVRCKDGSLKWILDSGKKSRNDDGEVVINSLYLDITKSELDAQKILQQKELLNSIYDTIPCGILRFIRKQDEYQIISLNRAALKLLGYKDRASCLADWRNGTAGTVLDEDRESLKDSYNKLKKVGDSVEISYRTRWPDGSIHWFDGTNMIVSSVDGQDTIQRILYDVTERKQLQEQLNREQEMYRVAMESSSDVMYEYLMDQDLFISYEPRVDAEGNESVYRLELPHYQEALRTQDFIHPDDVPAVIDNICRGRGEIFEIRLRPPECPASQGYFWYRVTGKLIFQNGRPCRVVGTLRNIHHVKQTLSENMEELHMNQSALQAISGVYMSIYYVDLSSGRYYAVRIPDQRSGRTYARSGHIQEDLFQYIRESVKKEDQEKMFHFCDPGHLTERLHAVNDRAEIEFCHRSELTQKNIWLRLEVHLISMENQKPKNVVMTFRNVTEERKQELQRRQEEKNAKCALEEAYEAANRANLAKSDFLSRMSHDIRTPMNAIMGMTAIAEQHLDNAERIAECLKKIRLSGEHLLELINEVLDMSKIENGSVNLNESHFNLNRMLQTVSEMIRPEVTQKHQDLQIDLQELQHQDVSGDLVRVQQILLNLLSNAVKYTPDGGRIRLSVKEKLSSTSGVGCYEWIVEDNGIGMSEAFQKRIFSPFERAADSRVSKIQGTGLGLAITQNLVRMMNGTIQVESCLNKGSRFTVTLYLKLADEESPRDEPPPVAEKISFQHQWRILLVEDNDLNREIAKELLEIAGLQVEEAFNGKAALELFQQSQPGYYQLILMDIQMPVMDGYLATQAIRALDRPDAVSIPIIALTANAFADDVYRAKQAGMNEHLSKPLEIDRLMQSLKRWLG